MTPRATSLLLIAAAALLTLVGTAGGQSLPYYIADGDAHVVYIVQNGTLQGSFPTPQVVTGYLLAVRSTVVLGDLADLGAAEYTLAGVPTGNTYPGGGLGDVELLDGTTDGVAYNYGVSCDWPGQVTRADLFWRGQAVLFDLPFNGSSLTYDPVDGTLWVSLYDGTVRHYTLAGAELFQFSPAIAGQGEGTLAGLAYDSSSDTLWMKVNGGSTIYQYSKAGVQLAAVTIPGFDPSNDWGGEMPMPEAQGAAPVPAAGVPALALLAAALLGLGALALRRLA